MIASRLGWATLALACLIFSWHTSRLAPCGAFLNEVFGQPAWVEADPGSYYFASAHELAWRERPLYVGHPGATLVPLLRLVQSALYHLGADADVSFTRFTTQHLPRAFLASKLLMTGLHLLSFVALYHLARRLVGGSRAAALAVLGYATSLPVLYYLSRISVEPLMILFFAAAFLSVWRSEDLAREGRSRAAIAYAGLAGVAAVSCAMSKLAFGAALPFLLAAQLAAGTDATEPRAAIDRRTRGRTLACFAAASLAALALYSQIIDWDRFIATWGLIGRNATGGDWELSDLRPGLGPRHIFLASESCYLVIAAVGCWLFLRDRSGERRRALWLGAYAGYGLAIFAYRVALEGSFLPFHYSFVVLAVAAPFFGYASDRLWRRWSIPAGWRTLALGVLLLGSVHGIAAAAVVDARRHDARAFARIHPVFPLVALMQPGDRLGVVRSRGRPSNLSVELDPVHGMALPFLFQQRRSKLEEEFESSFTAIPRGQLTRDLLRIHVPALDTEIALLPAAPERVR